MDNYEIHGGTNDHDMISLPTIRMHNESPQHETMPLRSESSSPVPTASDLLPLQQTSKSPKMYWASKWREARKTFYNHNPRKSSTAWRGGIHLGCLVTGLVLACNLGLLLVGALSYEGYENGIGTVVRGSKSYVDTWNTVLHLLVNVLSTGLLTASNYCMQILSAPTRHEIDAAHAKGTWLDIGVLSIRNYAYIERKRVLVGLLLASSSIPLHLFYNSAVFKVTSGQSYNVHFVNACNSSTLSELNHTTNLTNNEWRDHYSSPYVFDVGDLFLVVDQIGLSLVINQTQESNSQHACLQTPSESTSDLGKYSSTQTGASIAVAYPCTEPLLRYCNNTNFSLPESLQVDVTKYESMNDFSFYDSSWISYYRSDMPYFHVVYGLAVPKSTGSRVQISLHFIIVVIFCNVLKLAAMLWTLRRPVSHQILTLGDSISSFLEKPDLTTIGSCTINRRTVINKLEVSRDYEPRNIRLLNMFGQHTFSRLMIIAIILFPIVLSLIMWFTIDPNFVSDDYSDFKLYWGTSSPLYLPFTPNSFDSSGILMNSFISNCPHILLSFSYFSLNRICTSVSFEREWNGYALSKKALRVTQPQGEQRSTYFLQLPYRWAIPLIISSGILHWLLSQSIFLSRLEYRNSDGSLSEPGSMSGLGSMCRTGFSFISFLIFTICFLSLFGVLLLFSLRKQVMFLPEAGHCSLVLSAACHPEPGETTHHLHKVQWGVTRESQYSYLGHCSFTSDEVTIPEAGRRYM